MCAEVILSHANSTCWRPVLVSGARKHEIRLRGGNGATDMD